MQPWNKETRKNKIAHVLVGVGKRFGGVTSFQLGGRTVLVSDFIKLVHAELDQMAAVAAAQAAYRQAVADQARRKAEVDPLLRAFKSLVLSQFGDNADATEALADFGYTPRKSYAKTPAEKVLAVERAKATRAARHTMGSKQKASIKGAVTPAIPQVLEVPPPTPGAATPSQGGTTPHLV